MADERQRKDGLSRAPGWTDPAATGEAPADPTK
jgi:hypothetical protein